MQNDKKQQKRFTTGKKRRFQVLMLHIVWNSVCLDPGALVTDDGQYVSINLTTVHNFHMDIRRAWSVFGVSTAHNTINVTLRTYVQGQYDIIYGQPHKRPRDTCYACMTVVTAMMTIRFHSDFILPPDGRPVDVAPDPPANNITAH